MFERSTIDIEGYRIVCCDECAASDFRCERMVNCALLAAEATS